MRRWLAPAIGAALFAVVSCASCSSSPSGSVQSSSRPGASSTTPDFLGYRWRVVHLTTTGGLTFAVHLLSPGDPPRIQLTSDGKYGASDGVNYLSGRFTLTKSGFTARFSSTLVGYANTDPNDTAVIDGIAALLDQTPVTVSATSNPNLIAMTVKGYELTFQRDGTATTSAPEPSSTGPAPPIVYGTPPNCDLSTAPGTLPCPGDPIGPT
jgi:hypothetical protein